MAETRKTDGNQKDGQARKRKPPVVKNAAPATQAVDPVMVQLALVDPSSAPQASLLHLQRYSGNRAVHRLLQRSRDGQRDSTPRSASIQTAVKTQSASIQREASPGPAKAVPIRPPRRTNLQPNRGTLPKSESLNRPKSFSSVVQLKPALEPMPLAGEAEAGVEIAVGQTYVPPVAPPPAPPGLPNGKPNKSRSIIQAKLTVGPANDRYEQEADKMADRVMRMPNSTQTNLQRQAEDEDTLQRAAFNSDAGFDTTPQIEQQIQRKAGSGDRLPDGVRTSMESRFGARFSNVRIHTDADSIQLSRDLSAQAFTRGSDIFFGSGKYNPQTFSGQHLLAHELTHVVQQGQAPPVVRRVTDNKETTKLTNPRLADNERLRDIAAGGAPLGRRDNGDAVRIVQEVLVDSGYDLELSGADGKYGPETAGAITAFRMSQRIGPGRLDVTAILRLDKAGGLASGPSSDQTLNYEALFKDDKIDIALAIGFDDGNTHKQIEALARKWLKAHNFVRVDNSPGIEAYEARARVEYPTRHGGNVEKEVGIRLTLITPGVGAAQAFKDALANSEIVTYSGHARGGLGPDFDSINSPQENVVIGAHSSKHNQAGSGVKTPGNAKYFKKVKHKEQNDLEQMGRNGQWDTKKYRVWFFNACHTLDYLDEIRNGVLPKELTRGKLDVFGTTKLLYGSSLGAILPVLAFLDGILKAQTTDSITARMQAGLNESIGGLNNDPETKASLLKKSTNIYFHSSSSNTMRRKADR